MTTPCFKDVVFAIARSNETQTPCEPEAVFGVMIFLFSLLLVLTILGLVHAIRSIATTTNRTARKHLLSILFPSIIAIALYIAILCGVRTGANGYANIVLIGLVYAGSNSSVCYSIDEFGQLTLSTLKAQFGMKSFARLRSPGFVWLTKLLAFLMKITGPFVFLVVCVLFPLAPVGEIPYWVQGGGFFQRDFLWDFCMLGTLLNNLIMTNTLVLYCTVIRASLITQSSELNSSSVRADNNNNNNNLGRNEEQREELERAVNRFLFYVNMGIVGGICGFLSCLVIQITSLYIVGLGGPYFYLVFLFLLCHVTYSQYYTIFLYKPAKKKPSSAEVVAAVATAAAAVREPRTTRDLAFSSMAPTTQQVEA